MVTLLLESGADSSIHTAHGKTPLHIVAINRHMGIAEVLFRDCKCNVNARSVSGHTPFHYAATQGHLAMMEVLQSKMNITCIP